MSLPRKLLGLSLGKRLPRHEGDVSLPMLRAEVTIRRDRFGVPYVSASSDHDGYYAIGFCHAQDRAAQLEIIVRAVRGRLSAMIGKDGIPIDRLSRRIGFRRAAEQQLTVARASVRDQLAAYVRGVNAGLALGPKAHELTLLGVTPTRWEPADVQAYSALLCFALASNWDAELMRLKVINADGPEALAAIDTPYPGHLPTSLSPKMASQYMVDRLASDVEAFTHLLGHGGGSNAWAVAPSKTTSGRPILANDPHLVSQAPALTYLMQVRAPNLEVAGASWVGIPAFAPGHNGFAAWGATAAHADNTDLFLEQIDGDRVLCDDWVRCEIREEVIEVKGEAPIIERVLVGPRGPIIAAHAPGGDGAVHDCPLPHARANAISISATWLHKRPYAGLYRAHDAKSFDEFRALFEEGSTSTISAVYADQDGHIGWHLAVEVPKRKGFGNLPLPGWHSDTGWGEIIPLDELPRSLDPKEGFVCTANNAPTSEGDGPFLGVDWLDGYRQRRIADMLAAYDDWDIESTAKLQRDTVSLPWREMSDNVLACCDDDAFALLDAWDGQMSSSSVAASVYAVFCARMIDRIIRTCAPRSADWALGRVFTSLLPQNTMGTRRMGHLVRMINEQPVDIFADWAGVIGEVMRDSFAQLRRERGDDQDNWAWGDVRPLTLIHAFAEQKPFDRVFNIGPYPGEGDNSTVSQGGVDFTAPTHNQAWHPSLRAIFDVGNWDACRIAVLGGQSGNPCSRHYDDQADAWMHGDGVTLAWTEGAITARATKLLRLKPA